MQKILKPFLAVKTKSGYSILTATVVAFVSLWVLFDATKAEVVIAADGDVQVVKTHNTTVGDLLDELGFKVGQHDELSHEESDKIVDGMKIHFKSANEVLLTVDGDTTTYHTTALTVGKFFQDENLDFTTNDEVSHTNMQVLKDGMEIEVKKAFPIVVNDGGDEKEVWTTGGTVGDLLKNNNITYDEKMDKVK